MLQFTEETRLDFDPEDKTPLGNRTDRPLSSNLLFSEPVFGVDSGEVRAVRLLGVRGQFRQLAEVGTEPIGVPGCIAMQKGIAGLGVGTAMAAQQVEFHPLRTLFAQVATGADAQALQHVLDAQCLYQA